MLYQSTYTSKQESRGCVTLYIEDPCEAFWQGAVVPEGSSRALPVISTRGCGAGQDDVRRAEELRSTLSAELLSSSGVEGNPRKPLATCGPTR